MDWYRIKTILIFLFLAINLFLAALLGYESISLRQAEKAKAEAAAATLSSAGITISTDIPHKTIRLRSLTLENPYADEAAFATQLLGAEASRMGNVFRREGKTVSFPESGFSYESGQSAVAPSKSTIKAMKKALSDMGFLMTNATGTMVENAVVFTQEADHAPLFGCQLFVYPAADGTIARMHGTWANILETKSVKNTIRFAADALLSFLQADDHTGSEIVEIRSGYGVFLGAEGYRTADAVPAWCIKTADGDVHLFDARQ